MTTRNPSTESAPAPVVDLYARGLAGAAIVLGCIALMGLFVMFMTLKGLPLPPR